MNFSERLRELRAEKDVTQIELAKKTGSLGISKTKNPLISHTFHIPLPKFYPKLRNPFSLNRQLLAAQFYLGFLLFHHS